MPEISAAIISHNEENHIVRTLAALKGAVDEIVVVLNQDTNEQTEHICRSHGARVFRNPFMGYGQQKQFATACAVHNLILSIDADEAPDDVLINELNAIRKGLLTADAYSVGIKNFYCGKWMRFGGINSSKRIRLFNRNKGSWDNPPVHEKIILHNGATIFHLKGNILHIAYESREEHLRKLKKYARLSAEKHARKSFLALLLKAIFSPVFKFSSSYIFKLGFLEGKQGFQYALLTSYENWLKYCRALLLKIKPD